MKYLVDAHTHTIASGHAYNTIMEMAKAASQQNLDILGITEHTHSMPGTCNSIYFTNMKVIDRQMYGVELLLGAEINITGYYGELDLPDWIIQKLDIAIASIHEICMGSGTRQNNTSAIIHAIKNPFIDIIGHPDDARFEMDYEIIAKTAKEYKTLLEVNNSSLSPNSFRPGAYDNNCELLKYCKKYGTPIIIDSDAHFCSQVGTHQYADEVIKAVDFPEELIMNYFPEEFKKFTRKYKKS